MMMDADREKMLLACAYLHLGFAGIVQHTNERLLSQQTSAQFNGNQWWCSL